MCSRYSSCSRLNSDNQCKILRPLALNRAVPRTDRDIERAVLTCYFCSAYEVLSRGDRGKGCDRVLCSVGAYLEHSRAVSHFRGNRLPLFVHKRDILIPSRSRIDDIKRPVLFDVDPHGPFNPVTMLVLGCTPSSCVPAMDNTHAANNEKNNTFFMVPPTRSQYVLQLWDCILRQR